MWSIFQADRDGVKKGFDLQVIAKQTSYNDKIHFIGLWHKKKKKIFKKKIKK